MEKMFDLDVQVKPSNLNIAREGLGWSASCFCSILTDCWREEQM
ncbi:hypothetical protein [Tumebacillus permanentifrigoris]|uniref:Uncharacterized protein n=1 Tax=Tumebacillus permanentifrigoris TaxID=378543 RepID=A0A316DCJ7_9BACL|nr:hypothetical protein [Tumebacillus permanentifrigoris]PWK15007.1 hypothetical protein C7459_104213 [Tumebacillus permanentifrigoris]